MHITRSEQKKDHNSEKVVTIYQITIESKLVEVEVNFD